MGTVVSFTSRDNSRLLITGCHLAVSLPLPKCERCVKRGRGAVPLFGKPYEYWALRGLWLV